MGKDIRYIVFDTETTGTRIDNGHRIIEIGCLEIINSQVTNNSFHEYINPEIKMEAEIIKIHNITNEELVDKPKFADIADKLLSFLESDKYETILVAHNINFDMKFLNNEMGLIGKKIPNFELIDTLTIARKKYPNQKVNLDALCEYLNIDLTERKKLGHGALLDSQLLAKIFIYFLSNDDIKTLLSPKKTFFGFTKKTDLVPLDFKYKISKIEYESHKMLLKDIGIFDW